MPRASLASPRYSFLIAGSLRVLRCSSISPSSAQEAAACGNGSGEGIPDVHCTGSPIEVHEGDGFAPPWEWVEVCGEEGCDARTHMLPFSWTCPPLTSSLIPASILRTTLVPVRRNPKSLAVSRTRSSRGMLSACSSMNSTPLAISRGAMSSTSRCESGSSLGTRKA
jgi:hypothetical protein